MNHFKAVSFHDLVSNSPPHTGQASKISSFLLLYSHLLQTIILISINHSQINLSLNRNYFYKNILCFGDNLHSIHPLAGQGFNMNLLNGDINIKMFQEEKKIKILKK